MALLPALLSGCGGNGPLRAKAPSLPDEQARCRAAMRAESPLVTEWSPAEKANLQARLRSGAVAVAFSGCGMRPLPACNPRGSYRWQRTTLASEAIDIRDEDELFTKLPLGALALEGELARSGHLQVRTMVTGQYVLDGGAATEVPDYGPCAEATHLLTGLSIGSFKLHSGGTLQASANVDVGGYGGGAKTQSSDMVLREAGTFESCSSSTDENPDINCSSPIQAFLTPLPRFVRERGTGTLRATFASGDSTGAWELRSNEQFVCRTPCTRWINPAERYQLRTEKGEELETVDVPPLGEYEGAGEVVVTARGRDKKAFVGGIVTAGVGGGLAFMGGFLALFGAMGDRDGLVVAGAITAGIGVVAIAPGVWLIVGSGSDVEVSADGVVTSNLPPRRNIASTLERPPVLGISATY